MASTRSLALSLVAALATVTASCKQPQTTASTVKDDAPASTNQCTLDPSATNAASRALFACAANSLLAAATGGASPSVDAQTMESLVGALANNWTYDGSVSTPSQLVSYFSTACQNPSVVTALSGATGAEAEAIAGRVGALNIAITLKDCTLAYVNGVTELARQVGCAYDEIKGVIASNAAVQAAANSTVAVGNLPSANECSALYSRNSARLGQYCATGMQNDTYWFNSSIRRDCTTCCTNNIDAYERTGNQCNFSDDQVQGAIPDCTERCYMARGGT